VERPVKERLIGAAVLMAAAIILIPEMLSGPSRDSAEKQAQTAAAGKGSGESAIKTYTIDLSQSPGAQPPSPVEQTENRAPPPEEIPPPETAPVQPAAVAQASPEPTVVTPAEAPAQVRPAPAETPKPAPSIETPQRQIAAQPTRAEAPPKPQAKPESPKPEPRAVASAPSAPKSAVPTGKGWAVQLGSYGSEATAERIVKEWRGKGQSAFVMPVTTGGKTLYRVRIGPTKDRASAEAALKAVKGTIPSAAVVAHP
jgi:DedD protein